MIDIKVTKITGKFLSLQDGCFKHWHVKSIRSSLESKYIYVYKNHMQDTKYKMYKK